MVVQQAVPLAFPGELPQLPRPSRRDPPALAGLRSFRERVPVGTQTVYAQAGNSIVQLVDFRKVVGLIQAPCSSGSLEGMKVDHDQNLWVVCSGSIEEFAPGDTAPSLTYVDNPDGDYYFIADVAIDSAGDVWASSLYGFSQSNEFEYGQISYWAAGSPSGSSPTGTISDPNIGYAYFIDVDPAGRNVYVDYENIGFTGYDVDAIDGRKVETFDQVVEPGGIYTSANGNVNVGDQNSASITAFSRSTLRQVAVYGPVCVHSVRGCILGDPIDVSFNPGDTELLTDGLSTSDTGLVVGTNLDNRKHGDWKLHASVKLDLSGRGVFSPDDK
jgi:hypothetical protein